IVPSAATVVTADPEGRVSETTDRFTVDGVRAGGAAVGAAVATADAVGEGGGAAGGGGSPPQDDRTGDARSAGSGGRRVVRGMGRSVERGANARKGDGPGPCAASRFPGPRRRTKKANPRNARAGWRPSWHVRIVKGVKKILWVALVGGALFAAFMLFMRH